MNFPAAYERDKVGTYPSRVSAGGGYVWDEVLEYRVWFHVGDGADDLSNGHDYFHAFETFEAAREAALRSEGAAEPLALVLQREYIEEAKPGDFLHIKEPRLTEWPVEF